MVDRLGILAVALSLRSKCTEDFIFKMSAESRYEFVGESNFVGDGRAAKEVQSASSTCTIDPYTDHSFGA